MQKTIQLDGGYVEDYQICGQLGHGGQASVHLGQKAKQLYAIKIYIPQISETESFRIQKQMLEKLKFKHIINLIQAKEHGKIVNAKQNIIYTRPILVLQFAEYGDLFDYIREQPFPQQICRKLFIDLISAIQHLHSQGTAHRDIKLQNIMFNKLFILKVADFGLSKYSEANKILTSKVGTDGYKCPQLEVHHPQYVGLHADIFAAAVVLFIIFSKVVPFSTTKLGCPSNYNYIRNRKYNTFWEMHQHNKAKNKKKNIQKDKQFYSNTFRSLINSLFDADPTKRPTLEQLKNHEWMKGSISSQQKIQQELKKRYLKILQWNKKKQKIQTTKAILRKKFVQSQQQDLPHQIRSTLSQQKMSYENIETQNLPISYKRIKFVKEDPISLVILLKQKLQQYISNSTLIEMSCGQAKLYINQYVFRKNHILQIHLYITTQENDEIHSLIIFGQFVRSIHNQIGIQWSKIQGNDIYLSQIISKLNSQI